jgi:hypothetical protein
MKNTKIFQFALLSFLVVFGSAICFADEANFLAKKNLVEYIEREIQYVEQDLKQPYESAMYGRGSLEFKKNERLRKESLVLEQKSLKNMLRVVKNQSEDTLAAMLVEKFIEGNLSWEGHSNNLGLYIQVLGETAIPAIDQSFDRTSTLIKSHLLAILGAIRSTEAMPVIQRGIKDENKDVVLAAFRAWQQILGSSKSQEVEKVLFAAGEPLKIQQDTERIFLTGDLQWYDELLLASEKQSIPLYDLAIIVNFDSFPADVVSRHVEYLIPILQAADINMSEKRLAAQLLLKVTEPEKLKKFAVLLPDLLSKRFGQGGVIENYSDYPKFSSDMSPFSHAEIVNLSDRILIALNTEQIRALQTENSANQMLRMFFETELNKRVGVTIVSQEQVFNFRIDVADQEGNIVSTGNYELKLDHEQKIILPLGKNGFPGHTVTLMLKLDHEKHMFHLKSVMIDFKPHAASFDAYVSFSGSYEILLSESPEKQYKWIFTNLETIKPGN